MKNQTMQVSGDLILVNNVFTGDYISGSKENIGHEIINVFKSDNGKSYIYANPYGNIAADKDGKVKYVLFVRSIKQENSGNDKVDYKTIIRWINDESNWEDYNAFGEINNLSSETSILEITRQQNNELAVSNLLAYAIENCKDFRDKFIKEVLGVEWSNDSDMSVAREENNIDILIKSKINKSIIVIENKIKSDVSKMQLKNYFDYANDEYKEEAKHFFLLRPDYNNQSISNLEHANKYEEIKYSKIKKILDTIETSKEQYLRELVHICEIHSKKYDNDLFEIIESRFREGIANLK